MNLQTTTSGEPFATVTYLIDSAYKIASILYATPGNQSSDSFTSSTTTGTTTISKTFTDSESVSFSIGGGGDLPIGAGVTFGTSSTMGNSTAFTETITDAESFSNVSATAGPNTINHNQDLFLIWLNPEVGLPPDGSASIAYSILTPVVNGSAEPVDIIAVPASAMEDNASHTTSVQVGFLEPQADGEAGLAGICKNLIMSEYLNKSCTLQDQCGCVPSDFAPILAQDPLLRPFPATDMTTAMNPMTVDVSGASTCLSPQSTDDCRYVQVPASSGSSFQQFNVLAGPSMAGDNRQADAFTRPTQPQLPELFPAAHRKRRGTQPKLDFRSDSVSRPQTALHGRTAKVLVRSMAA